MTKLFNTKDKIALIVVALLYIFLLLISPDGFWIFDEGNRFLWARNFSESGSFRLEDKAEVISPGHSAFESPFTKAVDDGLKQVTVFSPLFIALISPLVKIGGMKLALVIPLLASILTVFFTKKSAERLGFHFDWLMILLLGIASPLSFYAVTLWEHSLALFIGLGGFYIVLTNDRIISRLLSGALFALAIYIRPEMGIFALAIGLFFSKDNRWQVIVGGVLSLLLMGLVNWLAVGNILPLGLLENYTVRWGGMTMLEWLLSRLDALYALVFEGSAVWYLSLGLVVTAFTYIFLSGILRFLFPLAILASIIASAFSSDPVLGLLHQGSLLFSIPMFFIASLTKAKSDVEKKLKHAIIVIIILTAIATPVLRGIHWGTRLLLPILPLMAILTGNYLKDFRWEKDVFRKDALIALILAQLSVTAFGLALLQERRSVNQFRTSETAGKAENYLISQHWWLQQEIPDIYLQRVQFKVNSTLELKLMLLDFYQKGVRFFTMITRVSEAQQAMQIFAVSPAKCIGSFPVETKFPSMDLIGYRYAIGFDVAGAASLADELGVYFGQMGDIAKSEKYLRLATAIYSQVGKYHYNLGYCLGMQKRYKEALEEMELAHKLDPGNELITKVLEEMRKDKEMKIEN
jgi:hypothetical protein